MAKPLLQKWRAQRSRRRALDTGLPRRVVPSVLEGHVLCIVVLLQGVAFLKAPKPGNADDAKKEFTDSLATALDYSLQDKGVDLLVASPDLSDD